VTTHLPGDNEEVYQYDVMRWAQEQAKFLTPPQTLVLWCLCLNAWYKPDNTENAPVGQVLAGCTPLSKIRMKTGLSDRAVRDALNALQDNGYIYRESKAGWGKSTILVFWSEGADEIREEFRAGVRDLPESIKRKPRTHSKRIIGDYGDNIVEFPLRHQTPE
jgi:hypothetical protein